MKLSKMFFIPFTLLIACGKESSSDNPIELPSGGGGSSGEVYKGGPDEDSFHYDILDKEGNKIPLSLTPSTIEDGKLVPTCKEGQIPYIDQCFDKIHIDASKPGFKLEKDSGEVFEVGLEATDEWLSTFDSREPEGNGFYHYQRMTYGCEYDCQIPSFLRLAPHTFEIEDKTYISRLELGLWYFFGRSLSKPHHNWLLNGTITILGHTFNLPVKRSEIRAVLPNLEFGYKTLEEKTFHTTMNFFISYGPWPWTSQNDSEDYLQNVSFVVDKYELGLTLKEENGE